MFSGFKNGIPLYLALLLIPLMLLGGGLEEAGWRYILQPEFEKKFPFFVSTIFVWVFWWSWHLLLFFITGTVQSTLNFFIYGISLLAISFVLATIKKLTGSVWLCILFHCIFNAVSSSSIIVNESYIGNLITLGIIIILVYVIHLIDKKKKLFK